MPLAIDRLLMFATSNHSQVSAYLAADVIADRIIEDWKKAMQKEAEAEL